MLLGVHEQYQGENATTPLDTKSRYPNTQLTREFKGGVIPPQNLIPSFEHLARPIINADMSVVLSLKPSTTDVFNGKWQLYIEQLARHILTNENSADVILTFWHEPEDDARDSYPNGTKKTNLSFNGGAEFVQYFNTLHDWVKGIDPRIQTSHAALGYGYRPKVGGPGDKSAYVTDASAWVTKADINAIDIYNGRSFPLDVVLGDSPAFNRWRDSRIGPWGVSERGWTTTYHVPAARAQAVTAELAWLATLPEVDRPAFYIAWLTEGVENDQGLKPDALMTEAINAGYANILTPANPSTTPPPEGDLVTCPLCHGTGTVAKGTYTVVTHG